MCKFANISFDIQNKMGTLFLLQSGLENGSISFMCIGNSRKAAREEALKLV